MLLRSHLLWPLYLWVSGLFLFCCEQKPQPDTKAHLEKMTAKVDDALLQNPPKGDWLSYGLNYSENRFSPLSQINADNVKELGLVWSFDLGSERGVESTPIVVDGIMYVTAPWSMVKALDVRTGKLIWEFDPKVSKKMGEKVCCDVVNRGVAIYKGKVFVAALDGRLIALNAVDGKVIWEQVTVDQSKPYSITGAPRVVKGKVIIGNGGADYGVRGYLTAYDAETGKQVWRFYSVPGDPSKPFENKAMEDAAKTWDKAGKWWEAGGGGTMWDAMAYDPELNLFYVGTGNGSPWNRRFRSPGGGDNLYLSSIIALNPDNGEYKWHYQSTPGDHWDFTATQHLILADLDIKGKKRKVIMQAPKNGFFFVIDRTNGEFISADPFVQVNWAKGYDEKGRPLENEEALYKKGDYEAIPGPYGAHNWHPMAHNPQTGLVYIPAQGVPVVIMEDPGYTYNKVVQSIGIGSGIGWNTGITYSTNFPKNMPFGHLLAWDPVKKKAAWKVEHVAPWNGGVLTTAGNLVFQGTADGRFVAYHAKTGEKLWESPAGTGIIAAPVTYEVDGQQYVTVAAGWGGVYGLTMNHSASKTFGKVYTFKLGGKTQMPAFTKVEPKPLLSGVEVKLKAEEIQLGGKLYLNYCTTCHGLPGIGGGAIPNLGFSGKAKIENLHQYVLEGALETKGMPNFKDRLKKEDVERIKAFIVVTVEQIKKQMEMAKQQAEAKK